MVCAMRRFLLCRPLAAAALLALAGESARAGKAGEIRVEAIALLNEGVSAYNQGDYPKAVEKLRRSADLALNTFRAYYYLGLALTGDRRYPEAIEALEVALDLDPTHLQAHIAIGNARLKQGDTDEALASFVRALKLRAEYAGGLDGIARVYEAKADDERAVEFFRRAIASNKGYAEAYANLGSLYLRQDRYEEAVRLLLDAVTIRADFAFGYGGLATAYGKLGLDSEAVVTIRKAIDLEPRSPEHRTTLGRIELDMGLLERSEASFRKALEVDPGYPDARVGLAEIARRRGDYAAASFELAQALEDSRLDSGQRREIQEKKTAVEAEASELAALEAQRAAGETPEVLRRLAGIYAGRRDWERAADLQGRSDPAGIERERYAYYLFRAGRPREAQVLYAELARGGGRADLEINQGVALARLGDDAGAVDAYRRALGLDPAEKHARLYLGNSLLRLGRRDEAVTEYKRYLDEVHEGPARARLVRILGQIAPGALPPAEPAPENPPGTGSLPGSGS